MLTIFNFSYLSIKKIKKNKNFLIFFYCSFGKEIYSRLSDLLLDSVAIDAPKGKGIACYESILSSVFNNRDSGDYRGVTNNHRAL